MTAQVLPLRPKPPTPPCGSGTQPGVYGTKVCGQTPSRPFACGHRCAKHFPANRKEAS